MTKTQDDVFNELENTKSSELKQEREQERARALTDLAEVMCTPAGARVLQRLLAKAHIYQTSMTRDTHLTAYREGWRSYGLWLLTEMNEADAGASAQLMHSGSKL